MRGAVLVAIALLTGCAAEPVPYYSGNEIPRGPGLLTGAQGEFVLNTSSISAAPRNEAEEREYQEWRESKRRREAGTE
jgi:hypothetical protein